MSTWQKFKMLVLESMHLKRLLNSMLKLQFLKMQEIIIRDRIEIMAIRYIVSKVSI